MGKHYAFEHHLTAEDLDGKVVGRDKSFKKENAQSDSSPERRKIKKERDVESSPERRKSKKDKRKVKNESDSDVDVEPKVSRRYKEEKKEKDRHNRKKEKKYVPNKEWRHGKKKKGASDTDVFSADSDASKTDVSEEYDS